MERFDHLLTQVVGDRLDGPKIGIYLSGGIDSPVLAAKAQSLLACHGQAGLLHAFTLVFDHLIPDQERYYSGLVAQALGIPQQIQSCDEFELYAGADDPDLPLPEPLNNPRWEWIAGYVHQVAAECPIVLTGTDGDSLLMASLKHHWRELWQEGRGGRLAQDLAWYLFGQRRLPQVGFRSSLKRLLGLGRPTRRPPSFPAWLNREFSERALLADRWAACSRPREWTSSRGLCQENLSLPSWSNIFELYDAGWTGSPLEFRHPMMDVRFVTFLLGLPAVPWCVHKELFRRWLRPRVPRKVLMRPKTPLVGDPVTIVLQRKEVPWLQSIAWEEEITDYVETSFITECPFTSGIDSIHRWLAPASLNHWLKRRKERNHDHELERSDRGDRTRLATIREEAL